MNRLTTKKSSSKKAPNDLGSQAPSSSGAFFAEEKLPGYIYLKNRNEDNFSDTSPVAFLRISKTNFTGTIWSVAYVSIDETRSVTFISDWFLGAVTKMLAWLMENGYELYDRK